jgi:hypothetical protein
MILAPVSMPPVQYNQSPRTDIETRYVPSPHVEPLELRHDRVLCLIFIQERLDRLAQLILLLVGFQSEGTGNLAQLGDELVAQGACEVGGPGLVSIVRLEQSSPCSRRFMLDAGYSAASAPRACAYDVWSEAWRGGPDEWSTLHRQLEK